MPPVIICYQVIDNTIRANMPENQSNINLSGHINLIINGYVCGKQKVIIKKHAEEHNKNWHRHPWR